jgi:hypothetical protein
VARLVHGATWEFEPRFRLPRKTRKLSHPHAFFDGDAAIAMHNEEFTNLRPKPLGEVNA